MRDHVTEEMKMLSSKIEEGFLKNSTVDQDWTKEEFDKIEMQLKKLNFLSKLSSKSKFPFLLKNDCHLKKSFVDPKARNSLLSR